jgi:hypothetical protein
MRTLNSTVSIVAVAIVAGLCGLQMTYGRATKQVDTGFVPFTARIVEKHFSDLDAKQPAGVNYITVGRQRNGSESISTSVHSPDGSSVGQVGYILDVNSRKEITLESFTKSAMTLNLSATELDSRLDSRRCPDFDELSEHSYMLSYDVVRVKSLDSSNTEDEWLAPYLSCFALKEVFITSGGSWNEKTVLSVTEGEPPSSKFDIPSGLCRAKPEPSRFSLECDVSGLKVDGGRIHKKIRRALLQSTRDSVKHYS